MIKCQSLLDVDSEIKEILTILSKVDNDAESLNLRELGESIFNLAASPACLNGMKSVQIQALANIGSILFSSDEKSISRSHLYEKILLAFFVPDTNWTVI